MWEFLDRVIIKRKQARMHTEPISQIFARDHPPRQATMLMKKNILPLRSSSKAGGAMTALTSALPTLSISTQQPDFSRRLKSYLLHRRNNSEIMTAVKKRRFDSPDYWRYRNQDQMERKVSAPSWAKNQKRFAALPSILDIRVTKIEAKQKDRRRVRTEPKKNH